MGSTDPGAFTYVPGGDGTGAQGTVPGVGQSYSAPAVPYVPYEYSKNAGVLVPGTGAGDITGGYGDTEHNGLSVPGGFIDGGQQRTLAQALADTLTMASQDPQGTQVLQQQLIRAGYLNPKAATFNYGTMRSADATYHALATAFNDAAIEKIDYRDLLGTKSADPKNKLGLTYWQRFLQLTGQEPIERHTTTTSVALSTPGDARSAAQDAYQKLLGRAATTKEVSALHAALNTYERSHPTTTSRDTVYDPQLGGAATDRSVSQSGGETAGDVQGMAESQVQNNDGKELAGVQTNRLVQKFEEMLGSAR